MKKFSINRILKAAIFIACLTIVFDLLISNHWLQRLRSTAQPADDTGHPLRHIQKEILSMPVIEPAARSHVAAGKDPFPGLHAIPKEIFLNPVNNKPYDHNACTGFQIII